MTITISSEALSNYKKNKKREKIIQGQVSYRADVQKFIYISMADRQTNRQTIYRKDAH